MFVLFLAVIFLLGTISDSYLIDVDEETQARIADIVHASRNEPIGDVDDVLRKYEMLTAALESIVGAKNATVESIIASVNTNGDTDVAHTGVPAAEAPKPQCHAHMECNTCVEGGCAWCMMGRSCRPDRAWECQGEQDHVGLSGIGSHTVCPGTDDLDRKRAERKQRKLEAAQAIEENVAKHKILLKSRQDTSADAAANPNTIESEKEKEPYDKIERWNDLHRRSKLAQDGYGTSHPYETLEVDITASSADIRKAYRRLSVSFHPDKNPGAEESAMALLCFKDISAAYEILNDPEKRAMYDDIGAGNDSETFDSQDAYEKYGQANKDNFYQGHKHITPLTESLWERRVGTGDEVWLVEFYAPWCSACKNLLSTYKNIADSLADDVGIEVGAVNCVTQPTICSDWFAISAYPTLIAANDKHGTRQEYHGPKDVASVTSWIRAVTKEWRWLFATANIIDISSEQQFRDTVLNSTQFWVVAFMDGVDCSACKTAKTNAMRLSASLRGYESDVKVAVVDCEEPDAKALCYELQGMPARPHAPVVKGYPSGFKPENSKGEVLYNANQVEPHVALEMLDHTLRMALADRVTAGTIGVANGFDGFAADDKPEEEEDKKPDPPPEPMWNGPARRDAVAWNTGGVGPPRNRQAIGGK